jgi:hypothetical protein
MKFLFIKALCLLAFASSPLSAALVSASAYLTTSLNNATGQNIIVDIPFNAVTFDDATSFNLSNGQYTCAHTGTLIITGIIEVSNVSALQKTLGVILINLTTNEPRYVYAINAYYLQDGVPPSGYSQLPFCETMKCTAGDVFALKVFVIGGTANTVNIIGGQQETRLSMNLFY